MGYKKICVHLVYDVNHGGSHKFRLVDYKDLTDITVDSVYSGVIYLYGIQPLVPIAETNKM